MSIQVDSLNGVDRCPHCSVSSPLLIRVWTGQTPNTLGNHFQWASYTCTRCGGLTSARSGQGVPLNPNHPRAVFPKPRSAHDDIPPIARTFLQQAIDTLHAPDAAAVMAGSAVDAMLKEMGYHKGSVYERIDKAVEDHKLTEGMASWAHSVRLGANRPRHADIEKPHTTSAEATQSVEFAEALGNFIFVLNAKIQRGIAAAKAPESKVVANRVHPISL